MSHASSTTRLLFVRHAQTVWNKEQRYAGSSEVALSPEGKQRIKELTPVLNRQPVDAIYSSPLARCLQTITPTATFHKLRVIAREDLKERNLGEWEGKTQSEIHLSHDGYHFPESAYNGDFRIPGAETLDELEDRVRTFIRQMNRHHPGQTVLVATHAGLIWILHARIVTNRPPTLEWPPNCSITPVIVTDGHAVTAGTQELSELSIPVITE